jgi:hypothetical protein
MTKITVEWLKANLACAPQTMDVERLFPDGVPVCVEIIPDIEAAGLSVWWIERFVLSDSEYLAGRDKLDEEYRFKMRPLLMGFYANKETWDKAKEIEYRKNRKPFDKWYFSEREKLLVATLKRIE